MSDKKEKIKEETKEEASQTEGLIAAGDKIVAIDNESKTNPEMEDVKKENSSETDRAKSDDVEETSSGRFNLGDTNKQTGQRGWYVIHTYAGYEEQVAENLRQRIETLKIQDKIFDVIVPKEKQIEIKNGKRKVVEKRIFPGYVIVDMIVTDYSWYIVRNTPNVTGFIGLGVRPTPMVQEEIDRIKKRMGVEEPKYKVDLRIDDLVRINDGPLKGFEGKVAEVDEAKGKIKVSVSMFGRETPVNLDFLQVKKM